MHNDQAGASIGEAQKGIPLSDNERALWLDCLKRPNFPGHLLPLYFHFEPEPSCTELQRAIAQVAVQFPRLGMCVSDASIEPNFTENENPKVQLSSWPNLPDSNELMLLAFAPLPLDGPLMQWQRLQIGSGTQLQIRHLVRCHHLLGDQHSLPRIWQALAIALGSPHAISEVFQAMTASRKTNQARQIQAPESLANCQSQPTKTTAAQSNMPALLADYSDAPAPSGLAISAFKSLSREQTQKIKVAAANAQLSTFELLLSTYANTLDALYGKHPRELWVPTISPAKSVEKQNQYDVCSAAIMLTPDSQEGALARAHALAAQVRTCRESSVQACSTQSKHGIVYSRAPIGLPVEFSGLSSNLEGHTIALTSACESLRMVLHALPAVPAAFASCAQIFQWNDRLHLSMQLDQAFFSQATATGLLANWRGQILQLIESENELAQQPAEVKHSEEQSEKLKLATGQTLSDMLLDEALRHGDEIALDDGCTQISYFELEQMIANASLPLCDKLDLSPSTLQAIQCYRSLRLGQAIDFRAVESSLPVTANYAAIYASSGSTAEPANIELSPGNIAAYAQSIVAELALKPGDRVLRFAHCGFDAALEEMLSCWLSGATLVCPIEPGSGAVIETRFEPFEAFSALLERLRISALNVATAWWHAAVQDGLQLPACVRQIVIGGEAANVMLWRQFCERYPQIDLVNTYGLTEACVSQFLYRGHADVRDQNVPIGVPLAHVEALLFHPDRAELCGELEPGELCLSGASLGESSRSERYFEHAGKRYLRTGDSVVRRADGVFQYLGRLNRSVKHLGQRLDLDGLSAKAQVTQAQLEPGELKRETQVFALWVSPSPGASNKLALAHVASPTHALRSLAALHQAQLVALKTVPRTSGGKPDYRAMQALWLANNALDVAEPEENGAHQKPLHANTVDTLIRTFTRAAFTDQSTLSELLSSLDWLRLRSAVASQFSKSLKQSDHVLRVFELKQRLDAHAERSELVSTLVDANLSTLHGGFLRAAANFPEHPALIAGTLTMNYAELHQRVQTLVQLLQRAGVTTGTRLAFIATRSHFDVLAMLAINAAGGAFVPLPDSLSAPEVRDRVAQVGAQFWLHEGRLQPLVEALDPLVSLCDLSDLAGLAYVLLTSGSSGTPKAVAVTHLAACNTLIGVDKKLTLAPSDVVLALSPTQFDLSIFDVFATLAAGATLVWPSEMQRSNPADWSALVQRHGVTIWNSVPSSMRLLLADSGAAHKELASLRWLLLSGDFVTRDLIQRARAALPNAQIGVLGGATEAGIWSCYFDAREISDLNYAPYGAALHGQRLKVDASLGEVGEIVISGASVALGYMRAGVLAQRFVDSSDQSSSYRTGDLGRQRSNGDIEILGRQDQQVKWRGLRVSVAELEVQLLDEPEVSQAAVLSLDSTLIAALVLRAPLSASERAELIKRLTDQWVNVNTPRLDRYQVFDTLPLSSNGKLDRLALRALLLNGATTQSETANASLPPDRETHHTALALWQQFLPASRMPEQGDWFSQGGHSLQALKLVEAAMQKGAAAATLGGFLRQPNLAKVSSWFSQEVPDAAMQNARLSSVVNPAIAQLRNAILVTGAAGMLAQQLIRKLSATTSRPLVLCVRASSDLAALTRMQAALPELDYTRIHVLAFDLAAPQLGWSDPLFEAIGAACTDIWHLAAEVNFLLSAAELAASNTDSAHSIFRLAQINGALLHFASSLGVFPYQLPHDVDEHSARPEGLFASGYASSKWHAEQLLQRLCRASDVSKPVRLRIYRLGLCVAQTNRAHDIVGMSRYALKLCKSWPDSSANVNALAADDAASALCLLSEHEPGKAPGNTLPIVWHVQNTQTESIRALHAQLQPHLPKRALTVWASELANANTAHLPVQEVKQAELARDMLLMLLPASNDNDVALPGEVLATHTQRFLAKLAWRPQTALQVLRSALLD